MYVCGCQGMERAFLFISLSTNPNSFAVTMAFFYPPSEPPLPFLPPECWADILGLVDRADEFHLAMVCADWRWNLRRDREKRGEMEWDAWDTCTRAAGEGSLRLLQWARECGCPWDEDTCAVAHRAIWMCWSGCLWDEDACIFAALGGLEVLQRARGKGCSE
jgi:hypothetical protein